MEGVELNPSFWSGKTVFITGHTGFKGSWLSLWLQRSGARVIGYSLPAPTNPSLFEEARVAEGMQSLEGDVRDLSRLSAAIAEHRPSIVIHMAAQALVLPAYEDPIVTYETNVMGTANVLEAVRRAESARVCIVVTTDKCYENSERPHPYSETDALGGYDPYASSKACAELVTASYRRSYFSTPGATAVATVRAGNVIGGGDWSRFRLIPDIIRAFQQGRPVMLRNPAAERPWQHVLDPLNGYLILAERLWDNHSFAEAWNFGPVSTDLHTVGDVVRQAAELWGGGASWEASPVESGHEASCLRLDCSKAGRHLGWQPHWSIDRALEETIDWYKQRFAGRDARELVEQQIREFEMVFAASSGT